MATSYCDALKSKPLKVFLKASVIIMLSSSLLFSCNNIQEELGGCILYCNPAECLVLDEEKCECINDLECIEDKNYKEDYGIKSEDCMCRVADGGKWCSALTGDSIKTWEIVYAYDRIRNDTLLKATLPYLYAILGGAYQYRVDHLYKHCWDDSCYTFDKDLFYWEFNDMIQPSKIIYNRILDGSSSNIPYEYKRTIIKLNPDTLITTFFEGQIQGWILLVPTDS